MKSINAFIIGIISLSWTGQNTFEIKGFSEKYIGKLTLEKGSEKEVFK